MSDSMIPEFLPTLSAGAHAPGSGEACVMEYVSLLAGEDWSDHPACTHPALAAMARNVNDRLPDCERHRLVPLIGRLFGTAPSGPERLVLSVRLAVWAAREVLAFTRREDRVVCEAAIVAAEGWCEGTVSAEECGVAAAANSATYAATYATYADAAAAAAKAAADAAAYAAAYAADSAANNTATYATYATYAYAADLVDLLSGFIDEYDRLTGRTNHRHVSDEELRALAEAIR